MVAVEPGNMPLIHDRILGLLGSAQVRFIPSVV